MQCEECNDIYIHAFKEHFTEFRSVLATFKIMGDDLVMYKSFFRVIYIETIVMKLHELNTARYKQKHGSRDMYKTRKVKWHFADSVQLFQTQPNLHVKGDL